MSSANGSDAIDSAKLTTDPKKPETVLVSGLDTDEQKLELTLDQVMPKLKKSWIHYPYLVHLNLLLLGAMCTQLTNGYDGGMMNNLTSLDSFLTYFNNPKGKDLGTLNNGVVIGTLVVTPLISLLSDRIGRRYTMIAGTLVAIVGAILQGCAHNTGAFITGRILIGVGTGLSCACSEIYLTETAYPTHRPSIVGLSQAGYPVGSFLGALVTWGPYNSSLKNGNWSWRIPSLIQAFFPLLQFCLLMFAPESPRYLVAHGKPEKARQFFVKYHAGGNEDSEIVNFQMEEIQTTLEAEKAMKMSRWSEWFKTRAMKHRLCIVLGLAPMIQWCGNSIVSYYLSTMLNGIGITSSMTKLKINVGISAYGMIWDVGTAFAIGYFARRTLFITGFLSMCLCYTIYTILSALIVQRDFTDKSLAYGAVVMIFAFQGFYHIVGPLGIVYYSEITPFSLRAKAAQLYIMMGNGAGLFNNYVNAIAMVAIGWKYYIVWTVWLAVMAVIVYFFFPETFGKSLEEMSEVFGDPVVERSEITENYEVRSLASRSQSVNTEHASDKAGEAIDAKL